MSAHIAKIKKIYQTFLYIVFTGGLFICIEQVLLGV